MRRNSTCKIIRRITLLALPILLLCGCAQSQVQSCNHNYYLADYKEATASESGYRRYTCSNCGNTYQEVVPYTGTTSSGSVSSGENSNIISTTPSTEVDLTREKSVNLFDLPVYSKGKRETCGPDYCSEITDIDGWKHTDCYEVCGTNSDYSDVPFNSHNWSRYELGGKWSVLTGKIYKYNTGGSAWLEFYDGEEFLASSPKIGAGSNSAEFEIDITGVEYLTVKYCSTDASNWIICDDIILSK